MELTLEQKQEFARRGYVKLPGVVPAEMVARARRAINASLGQNGMDPAQLPKFRAQTYCPELTGNPVITGLYNETPIKTLAESAIGQGQIKPVNSGQIALRFPSMDEPPREPGPHLDGMYSPTNGVKEGTIANFTALVGVFLSDVPAPYAGNFTTWPGTHTLYKAYFREHGPQSLLEGMPRIGDAMPQPEQFLAQAGDAALVHYQLAHGIAGNASPNVRYAIFFRLHHVDHDKQHFECMTDIWREWSGMRGVVVEP